jgi:acyl transferase domain-containing protein/NADPH:quinone reductase-like Zn-dependent oxidoreductase/NAD(P)-dependent dehydrogenase (short-subunit alcohol dehydrogenase family)/acyl carrier protein
MRDRCWNEDGTCHSFDNKGTGYGRGEGAGIVVLKRLDDAIRDGDPIRAIIRGSGINQDGKTNGITVPKSEAQQELIESVYLKAGLDPKDTTFVEAHGTGTAVGDPLEVAAIRSAFRRDDLGKPLYIGSIKPNIGHLESASGIASLVKGVLMLQHGKMPATIGIQTLKPNLALEEHGIQIPQQLMDWPAGRRRRVSVNNFGYGGTNAHLILESLEERRHTQGNEVHEMNGQHKVNGFHEANGFHISASEAEPERAHNEGFTIITLSAKTSESVIQLAKRLDNWVSSKKSAEKSLLRNMAFTLSSRRSHMPYRLAFPVSTFCDIQSQLKVNALVPIKAFSQVHLIMVFTGQGAQWHAMGRELMMINSPFRESLERSNSVLQDLGASWSLIQELMKDEQSSRVNESEISQPATTALQIALLDLLTAVDVKPNTVVGHSSGEIAAAYAAGALSQTSAIRVAFFRGQLGNVDNLQGGAMLAVGLGEAQALPYLAKASDGRAVIACANSASSCTLSGDASAIDAIEFALTRDGVFARKLKVDRAYHSHHMQSCAEKYLLDLDRLDHRDAQPSISFFSSVTGMQKTSGFEPAYWVENLVSKVRFNDALSYALQIDQSSNTKAVRQVLVEIGPHNALAGPVRQIVAQLPNGSNTVQCAALIRDENAQQIFARLAATLFKSGCAIDITYLNSFLNHGTNPKVLISLPSYPWNHSIKYWHESQASKQHRFRKHPYHDLVGIQSPGDVDPWPVWRHFISLSRLPWLAHHVVDGDIVFPASGYICMVIEGVRQKLDTRGTLDNVSEFQLSDVRFTTPLIVPQSGPPLELQLRLIPIEGSEWNDFRIVATKEDGSSIEHCRGSVMAELDSAQDVNAGFQESALGDASVVDSLRNLQSSKLESIDVKSFYEDLRNRGNAYGLTFATMEEMASNNTHALSSLHIPDLADQMPGRVLRPHLIHPTVLDTVLHPSIALFQNAYAGKSIVTASIGKLHISPAMLSSLGTRIDWTTKLSDVWGQSCTTDIFVYQHGVENTPTPVLKMGNLGLRALSLGVAGGSRVASRRDICYQTKWEIDVDDVVSADIDPDTEGVKAASVLQAHKLQLLNQASALYINRCLEKMEEPNRDAPHPSHERLFEWMKRFRGSEEAKLPALDIEDLLQEAHGQGVEGEVLSRIGPNLHSILLNKMDPLALITEEGLLWRLYADDSSSRCYTLLINYLKFLVFKKPNMTILEIGAGTGGATQPILDSISTGADGQLSFASYDFTDVSPAFFNRARERLSRYNDKIRYRKLDVEGDIIEQGFQEYTYDLVIASNVLHVSTSIDTSLSRIRRLLKSDGRLLLIEATRNGPFYNTCFGVLPGWWAGASDERTHGPFLSEEQWDKALARNHLGGADVVGADFVGPAYRCAMIASKPVRAFDTDRKPEIDIQIMMCPNWDSITPKLVVSLLTQLRQRHSVTVSDFSSRELLPEKMYIVIDNGSNPALKTNDAYFFKSITRTVSAPVSILWISVQELDEFAQNPEKGLITGFARAARAENKSLKLITLDVQDSLGPKADHKRFGAAIEKLVSTSLSGSAPPSQVEQNWIFKNDQLRISRVIPDRRMNDAVARDMDRLPNELQAFHQQDRPLCLRVDGARLLDHLEFQEDNSLNGPLNAIDVEVSVHACGVNFKDLLIASGHLKNKISMAGEFAGVVVGVGSAMNDRYKPGDRVCGFGSTPYASRVRVSGASIAKMGDNLTFSNAASVPVVFATAYHALVDIARLEKGQRILIHSAAGGIGQAAVGIAKWLGAEIFATVGSAAKKEFLIQELGIPETHIFSSRTTKFKEAIHRITGGSGVQAVLNSLSGQFLRDSLDCVSRFGTFVELGKTDLYAGTRLSMAPLDRNITIASVDMSLICMYKPETVGQLIERCLSLIERQELKMASPVTVLPIEKIGTALRTMQNRNHTGKIVLDASANSIVEGPPLKKAAVQFKTNATYIIAGGLGGLGFEIAKYLATNGAKHIVLLSRRQLDTANQARLVDTFSALGADIQILSCDITKPELQQCLSNCLQDRPPVSGVIQSAMVLRDRTLSDMSLEDFTSGIALKVYGTQNLLNALADHALDFVLLISSVVGGVIGTIAEANYAAANAYMNSLANSKRHDKTRFIALGPGAIEDVGIVACDSRARKMLERQGILGVMAKEIIALVDFALSTEATQQGCVEMVSGFDLRSLYESDSPETLLDPLFSHLRHSKIEVGTTTLAHATDRVEDLIAAAKTKQEAEKIVVHELTKKIGTLVAMSLDDIDVDARIADLGIDSLVVVELKNWIAQTFQAKLHSSEIANASNITNLGNKIASKSSLVTSKLQSNGVHDGVCSGVQNESHADDRAIVGEIEEVHDLPKQPLPALDSSLENWLKVLRPVLSAEEHLKARDLAERFSSSGGRGRKLQARLVMLASDPTIENWQEDLTNRNHHLRNREPLVPQRNYFGTHPPAQMVHTSAERAAIIATACCQFRDLLEAGQIEHEIVNGQKLETAHYQWLFNCTREPRKNEDVVRKYPGNKNFVVFRQGHVFQFDLAMPYSELKAHFQSIINRPSTSKSWAGVLTTDNRDAWAENRRLLQEISPENAQLIHMIEAAAFVIYLDNSAPKTARERGHLFLHADGFNRWCDKTVQFAVCDNGWSAIIGEHSMIDGYTMRRLNEFVVEAIQNHVPVAEQGHGEENKIIQSFTFQVTPLIEQKIVDARAGLLVRTSVNEMVSFETTSLGVHFFRRHKVPPKSGVQVAIQLASRKYFGYNPLAHETVSQSHFLKGRLEIGHTLWPEVKLFCDTVSNSDLPLTNMRPMLLDAVKAHASNLMRYSQGHGHHRHLQCLQYSIREGEEMPEFFTSEIYGASRPRMLTTDCLETGLCETGSLAGSAGGIWVHFEVQRDRVRFSAWGPQGRMDEFEQMMLESARIVQQILESS